MLYYKYGLSSEYFNLELLTEELADFLLTLSCYREVESGRDIKERGQ